MSTTDFSFHGLDALEQQLTQMIEQEYPREFKALVVQVAQELSDRAKGKTPVSKRDDKPKGGHLKDNWHIGKIQKRGNEYSIEVSNNTEYAEHVEYGHRTRGGKGFVPGAHMLELSLAELEERLPGFVRDWLSNFIATHEL